MNEDIFYAQNNNMHYNISLPPAHLSSFVQYFWQVQVDFANKKNFTHISTASSCSGLQFYFEGGFGNAQNSSFVSFEKAAVFHGQTNSPEDFITNGSAGIFGVKFYPFAVPLLFGVPATELTNQILTLDILLGSEGTALIERIYTARDFTERVDATSQFLINQMDVTKPLDGRIVDAVHLINLRNGITDLASLLKKVSLSERQFERKFNEMIGFTPKSYAKIVRFEYAKNCFETNTQSFTDIATLCGYYDQAHFNRDFKALSGHTPKAYHRNYSALKPDV